VRQADVSSVASDHKKTRAAALTNPRARTVVRGRKARIMLARANRCEATMMTSTYLYFIGIDGAKGHLDVAVRPTGPRWGIPYSEEQVQEVLAQLAALPPTLGGRDTMCRAIRSFASRLTAPSVARVPLAGSAPPPKQPPASSRSAHKSTMRYSRPRGSARRRRSSQRSMHCEQRRRVASHKGSDALISARVGILSPRRRTSSSS
jgi:hypothetical protein